MIRLAAFLVASSLGAQTIAITGVNVVDLTAGTIVPGQTVVVTGNRITALGPAASTRPPAQTQVIDGSGHYLMPGLWDMHVHLRSNPVDRDRPLVDENAATLELFLAHGVVGVREMGGDLHEHVLRWRDEIAAGKRLGPRILTAGRKLDGAVPSWPGSVSTMSAADAREAVKQMKKEGADFIKVYYNEVELPLLRAVLEEAHAQGLKVTGHLPRNLTLAAALEAGLDGMEHGMYLRTPKPEVWESYLAEGRQRAKVSIAADGAETTKRQLWMHDAGEAGRIYAQLAARPFWVTPTLMVEARVRYEISEQKFDSDPRKRFFDPAIWASWNPETGRRRPPSGAVLEALKKSARQVRELTVQAHKAGVPLLAGTDCGVSNNYVMPGWSIHEELAMMVEAGLTPAEALRTATSNAARWRGTEATEGAVAEGMRADLLLLRANPLTAIGATRELEALILGGRIFPRSQLDAMLRAAASRVEKNQTR
ncbi:MAG: amidohydrolase family protein [Acidobacteria bacterium]|nr:amidohydrolase family protein [Acidobacteriota bacterium]